MINTTTFFRQDGKIFYQEENELADNINGFKTITVSRAINSPRERVYKALITPDDIMRYHYADDGWSTPFAEIDPKPGGEFKIGFASPDNKQDFTFGGTFSELIEPEIIAYKIADGRPVTYNLEESEGKTLLEAKIALENLNSEQQQQEGWIKIIDHLAEYLEAEKEQ